MEIGIGEFRKVVRVMVVFIGEDVNKEVVREEIDKKIWGWVWRWCGSCWIDENILEKLGVKSLGMWKIGFSFYRGNVFVF